MAEDWKARLAELNKFEATLVGVVFFALLAVLDALIPAVDIFGTMYQWAQAGVDLVVYLVKELRGAAGGGGI